jgi:hypothetical protein
MNSREAMGSLKAKKRTLRSRKFGRNSQQFCPDLMGIKVYHPGYKIAYMQIAWSQLKWHCPSYL